MAITIASLQKQYPNVTFEDDGNCYTATAPKDHTLDGDLHEYVAEYRPHKDGPTYRKTALADLAQRLGYADLPQCTGPCDWCERD